MSKSRTQAQAQWYLDILTIAFISSSGRTQQYADFEREAKKWLAGFCKENGYTQFELHSNHFEFSGFFKVGGQWWYFNSCDVRGNMNAMMVRTAAHNKDYSGGRNQWVGYDINFPVILRQTVERTPFQVIQ